MKTSKIFIQSCFIAVVFTFITLKVITAVKDLLQMEMVKIDSKVSSIEEHLKKETKPSTPIHDTIRLINNYPEIYAPGYLFDSIRNIVNNVSSPVLKETPDSIIKPTLVKVLHPNEKEYQSGEHIPFVIITGQESPEEYFIRFTSSSPVYPLYHVDSIGNMIRDDKPDNIENTFLKNAITAYYLKEEQPGTYDAVLTILKGSEVVNESRIKYTINRKKIHVFVDSLSNVEDYGNTKNIFFSINTDIPSRNSFDVELLMKIKSNRDTLEIPIITTFPVSSTSHEVNYQYKVKGRIPHEFKVLSISIQKIIQMAENVEYVVRDRKTY